MRLKRYLTEQYGDIYISGVRVTAREDKPGKYIVTTEKTQHGLAGYDQFSKSKKRKPMTKQQVLKYVKSLQKEMKDPKSIAVEFMRWDEKEYRWIMEGMDFSNADFLKKLGDPVKTLQKIIQPLPKQLKRVRNFQKNFANVITLANKYEKTRDSKDVTMKECLWAMNDVLSQLSFFIPDLTDDINKDIRTVGSKLRSWYRQTKQEVDRLQKIVR